jgi:acetolactate synthase I/III small subunit
MKHIDYTFILQVRDAPGVLVRIAQVFARRGCNIRSLHVQPKPSGQWSTMKIDAFDISRPEQMQHQLEKLIDVHSVTMRHHTVEDKK